MPLKVHLVFSMMMRPGVANTSEPVLSPNWALSKAEFHNGFHFVQSLL